MTLLSRPWRLSELGVPRHGDVLDLGIETAIELIVDSVEWHEDGLITIHLAPVNEDVDFYEIGFSRADRHAYAAHFLALLREHGFR